jgi:hypothetical protein
MKVSELQQELTLLCEQRRGDNKAKNDALKKVCSFSESS